MDEVSIGIRYQVRVYVKRWNQNATNVHLLIHDANAPSNMIEVRKAKFKYEKPFCYILRFVLRQEDIVAVSGGVESHLPKSIKLNVVDHDPARGPNRAIQSLYETRPIRIVQPDIEVLDKFSDEIDAKSVFGRSRESSPSSSLNSVGTADLDIETHDLLEETVSNWNNCHEEEFSFKPHPGLTVGSPDLKYFRSLQREPLRWRKLNMFKDDYDEFHGFVEIPL